MRINRADLREVFNIADQTCFGCGERNPIGLQMKFQTDGQRLYSFVTVPPAMAGWDQTVHGGIATTMLDEIMGWTVIYLRKKIVVTRSITVEFLKPVQVEKPLIVVGSIEEEPSDRQIRVTGTIYCDDDVLCTRATGTFAMLSAQSALRLGVMSADYWQRFQPILRPDEER